MFMFVFALILISIVGLFLQVVNALALFFAFHQLGMGQQIFAWQNMAAEYACTSGHNPHVPTTGQIGPTSTDGSDPVSQTIHGLRGAAYQGRYWPTVIFDGTYGGQPQRLVLTYIPTTGTFGGLPAGEVARQFRKSFKDNDYQFTTVYATGCPNQECIKVIVGSADTFGTVEAAGIPASVPVGASGIISSVPNPCP